MIRYLRKIAKMYTNLSRTWAQCEYALRMGIKLLLVSKVNGWDSEHAHEVLDFPRALDSVISKLEAMIQQRRTARGQTISNSNSVAQHDIFAHYLRNMQCIKAWSEKIQPPALDSEAYKQQSTQFTLQDQTDFLPHNNDCYPHSLDNLNQNMDGYLWAILNGSGDEWMGFAS